MRRAVLDPNALISAYISPRGAPARLFELSLNGELRLVLSPRLLAELDRVLRHGRGLERYREPARIEAFLAAVRMCGEMHCDQSDPPHLSRDASDDYLVVLAGQAAVQLVSGDPDLTRPGLALSPRQFLDDLLPDD